MRACPTIAGLIAVGVIVDAPATGATRAAAGVPKLAAAVSLENKRQAPLLHFEIVTPARDKLPETIIGKLERPLAPGEAARLPLTGGKGCVFEARWAFEDIKDSGDVDLCNDAHIVLVD
jgi:hypothetical protein